MKMPKHSDEDKARFRDLVPEAPGVEVKPMFGSVGAFVNGNMFAGLFGPNVGVKLDPEGLEELRALEGLARSGRRSARWAVTSRCRRRSPTRRRPRGSSGHAHIARCRRR